jgi:hypothetical protein
MTDTEVTTDLNSNENEAPEVVAKADTTKQPIVARELLRSDAGTVDAGTVTMDRSGAESISAERVTMERSGSRTLEAKSVQMANSGVVMLNSDHTVLQGGSALFVKSRDARIVKSKAVALIAENAIVEGELKTLVHVGPASGNVKTFVDAKGAGALGVGLAVVLLLFGRLFRRKVAD